MNLEMYNGSNALLKYMSVEKLPEQKKQLLSYDDVYPRPQTSLFSLCPNSDSDSVKIVRRQSEEQRDQLTPFTS